MSVTISVVTPSFNAQNLVAATIRSVVNQSAFISGRAKLQYILQDGGSRDDTVKQALEASGGLIEVRSSNDRGMYDALAKVFRDVEGDIVCYLNAGDFLMPGAFDVILDVFENRDVHWISGMTAVCNEAEQITDVRLPFIFRGRLISCGAYGRFMPWIQQETLFWRRDLLSLVDYEFLASLRLAGDYYLWTRFATKYELHVVQAILGVFKYHRGQLSENIQAYRNEVLTFTRRPTILDYIIGAVDRLAWLLEPKMKKYLNRSKLLRFDHVRQLWH